MGTIFTILTGTVLALAALFAYFIQRARYLRETEPDLELTWPNSVRVGQMSHTLKEFWSLHIDVEAENKSKNHAEDLRWEVEVTIFPERGRSYGLVTKYSDILRLHPPKLLAGRRCVIPVYIGWNYAQDLYDQLQSRPGSLEVVDAGFHATVTVNYFTKREFLMFVLCPWNRGREKYKRSIEGWWGFLIDQNVSPPYVSRPWEFPKESLHTQGLSTN